MQSYTEISESTTLKNSRTLLLNNDKTVLSNSSGTSFPTQNLQIGQFCFRTDVPGLYQYTAANTWKKLFGIVNGNIVFENVPSYSNATQSAAGLMSSADKTKLDGVATGANAYSLPTASASTKGGIKVGNGLSMNGETLNATGYTLPTASASTKGGIKVGSGLSMNGETLNVSTADTLPVGSVVAFAAQSTPSGYLLCDGSAVSRSTYSALYSAIGTKYGSGNGSTTFNLPNLADKFIQGNATVGTAKSAGLPNIKGEFFQDIDTSSRCSGAFAYTEGTYKNFSTSSSSRSGLVSLNASRSSSVYSDSVTTVQPPAVTMRYCIKY